MGPVELKATYYVCVLSLPIKLWVLSPHIHSSHMQRNALQLYILGIRKLAVHQSPAQPNTIEVSRLPGTFKVFFLVFVL